RDAIEADAGTRPLTGHRGDADDPSAVVAEVQTLVMDGTLDPGERAEDIDVEDLPGGIEIEVDEGSVDGVDADIRHKHVEATELLRDRVEDLCSVRRIIGLAGDAECGAVGELRDRLGERFGVASREDHGGTLGVEPTGNAEPDASAGAGDQGDLAFESASGLRGGCGAV